MIEMAHFLEIKKIHWVRETNFSKKILYCIQTRTRTKRIQLLLRYKIAGSLSRTHKTYSSSSSSPPPAAFLDAALRFLLFTRPGLPPPKGLERAKSMCFCESTLTRNDATFTTCFPTLAWFSIKIQSNENEQWCNSNRIQKQSIGIYNNLQNSEMLFVIESLITI